MEQKPLYAAHCILLKRVFSKDDLRYWIILWLLLITIFSISFGALFSSGQKKLEHLNEINLQIMMIDSAFHQKKYLSPTAQMPPLLHQYKEGLERYLPLFPSAKPWEDQLARWSDALGGAPFYLTLEELHPLTSYLEKECYLFTEKGIDYHYSLIQNLKVTQQTAHRYRVEAEMLQGTIHADLS